MAEILLISASKGILEGLLCLAKDQINDQIKLIWGFKEDLEKLCERLTIIQGFLHDAANQEIPSEAMMVWLKSLKAATCKAENVLDELAYEDLRRKIEVRNRMRNKVRDLFTLSDPLSFRFKMANKVNSINVLLDRVCKVANDIGLKQLVGPIVKPMEFRITGPSIGDTTVVGRDRDVAVVVDLLLGSKVEGYNLPVIAIVGMPGLGKTTLAQMVYNKPEVMEYFCEKGDKGVKIDKRMWICVSDDFKVDRLLNEMVECLTGKRSDLQNRQGVLVKLGEKLKGKKYLLVLDDVWNTDPHLWVVLRNSLIGIGGSKESKILVTTRTLDVVLALENLPYCTHQLTLMSKEDCWDMFRNKAFSRGGPIETPTLVNIGRTLVERCKGVPLAISTLGGLLYSKHHDQEWESIEKSEIWSTMGKTDGILPVLRLSFDHLPSPSLKRCFAYCSNFPKDQVILKDELIQLWMGLGYLQPSSERNEEMEELGNGYFRTLWSHSLFQEVEFDEYNNAKSCKMHDLVHDLALDISKGDSYTPKDSEMKINTDVQHLSLVVTEETRLEISNENVRKLRTLLLKGDLPQSTKRLKCLRALRLVNSESATLECCKSKHLRFLDISQSSIQKVPNFVSKFYNLETLRLPPYKVEALPKDFHNLVSLRHFYFEDTADNRKLMPMKIGKLTSLQTLPFFVVGEMNGHKIEELGSLSKLRGRLRVYHLQHVKDKEEAEKAKIAEKSGIQEFRFEWGELPEKSDNNHKDVLEGLKPHKNVKALELISFGGRRWASWMGRDDHSLQNLVKIKLECFLWCEQVPPLGHLPHLAYLEMGWFFSMKSIGLDFYGAGSGGIFPALINFKLNHMLELEEWLMSSPAATMSTMKFFPHLQELDIKYCPKLITLPAFKDSTSLRKLDIELCFKLTCLPEGLLQPTLEELSLWRCPKLKSLNPIDETEAAFNVFPSLRELQIQFCEEVRCLPQGLLQPNLKVLYLFYCLTLETPKNPDALRSLTSLKDLCIVSCPNWGSLWEEGLFCTTSLETLTLGDFGEEYRYFPWPSTSSSTAASPSWSHFTSLKVLTLWGWPEVKSLPNQLDHLPALRELVIVGFSGLESLPECLASLKSLESLKICKCPLVEKRCEEGIGEDWHKIAHIPNIEIGSQD